ncbi:MAG: hypothetical protein MJ252_11210 [archaeon]|nr:hypothetical protein [archaeon]
MKAERNKFINENINVIKKDKSVTIEINKKIFNNEIFPEEEEKKGNLQIEEKENNFNIKDNWKFASVLQFINLFHQSLQIENISTYELEFSILHTDIDPLCANVLSKLIMKKELHRPNAKTNNLEQNNQNQNNQNIGTNINNSVIPNNTQSLLNNTINPSMNQNINQNNTQVDIPKLNDSLVKKLNFFYKTYIRHLKKTYNLPDLSTIFDIIKKDIEEYNKESEIFSLTFDNVNNKYYSDMDVKSYLIINFFRELEGKNPLQEIKSVEEMTQFLSNNPTINQEIEEGEHISFINLSPKQKIEFLYFFMKYAITISGRAPIFKEEFQKSKDDYFLKNKKIYPIYIDKFENNYFYLPSNKDCRIYKEKKGKGSSLFPSNEEFQCVITKYENLEKILEKESQSAFSKKIKESLEEIKTNDEEEKKKKDSLLRKQEMFEKAKKLSQMNTSAITEIEKYNRNEFLLMNISNHVTTRHQLSQITKTAIQEPEGTIKIIKPHELTEEEKHRLKVERENLEREKRMEKRNKIQEDMMNKDKLKEEKEEKFNNRKRNRDSEYNPEENKAGKRKIKKKKYADEESEFVRMMKTIK